MHYGREIDSILSSRKDKLIGLNTPFYITSVLDRAFKKTEIPISFKLERYEDYGLTEFSIGGVFDSTDNRCYVVLNFPKYKKFNLSERVWKDFKFTISQTCQHELIHLKQNSYREDTDDEELVDFRKLVQGDGDDRDYLAEIDEIDAYAHDIAMEILMYYPFSDPYHILRTINDRSRLYAYSYYCKTFKDDDWSDIRKLLLKKVYKWLPHVTYTKD